VHSAARRAGAEIGARFGSTGVGEWSTGRDAMFDTHDRMAKSFVFEGEKITMADSRIGGEKAIQTRAGDLLDQQITDTHASQLWEKGARHVTVGTLIPPDSGIRRTPRIVRESP
jgi:hypothetical protein